MNKILFGLTLILLVNNLFSQHIKVKFNRQIILIGEHHYFYNTFSKEKAILNEILEESDFKNIVVAFEKSPDFEYWMNQRDTTKIKEYFYYSTDKYFSKDTLTALNKVQYDFYKKIVSDKRISKFYGIDSHYKIRPVLFTLLEIIKKYKAAGIYNEFYQSLVTLPIKKHIQYNDTLIVSSIRDYFIRHSEEMKKEFSEYDYYYFNRIINTPFILIFFDPNRDKYMAKNIIKLYDKDTQIVVFVGSGHIKKSNKNRLGDLLKKEFNTFWSKKVMTVGLIPESLVTSKTKRDFDYFIEISGKNIYSSGIKQ